jgi:hypothetical protein
MIKVRFLSLLLLLSLSFSQCKNSSKDISSIKKVGAVLADLQVLEVQMGRMPFLNADSTKVVYKELEREVFKKHKMDSAQYMSEYNKMAEDKALLLEVYKEAENIIRKKTEANRPKP